MNRRSFLAVVASAGAAVGLRPAPAAGESPVSLPLAPRVLTLEGTDVASAANTVRALHRGIFEEALGARFTVAGSGARRLELIDVHDESTSAGVEQFTAMFCDPDGHDEVLGEGLASLSHPRFGELTLFLQPASDDPRGACYRASVCVLSDHVHASMRRE
jgi:hypothetical protein